MRTRLTYRLIHRVSQLPTSVVSRGALVGSGLAFGPVPATSKKGTFISCNLLAYSVGKAWAGGAGVQKLLSRLVLN